ncbi:hypothetical protein ACFLYL_02660 [Chloroflexota bacterium]
MVKMKIVILPLISLTLVVICVPVFCKDATVSKPDVGNEDYLSYLVKESHNIVFGTITGEKSYTVTVSEEGQTGKTLYTIFTLSVEKIIKGDYNIKEVLFKKK